MYNLTEACITFFGGCLVYQRSTVFILTLSFCSYDHFHHPVRTFNVEFLDGY